jgi:hypothetical protein
MPNISLDIEDILDDCTDHEIKDAIDWLVDNDFFKGTAVVVSDNVSPQEEEFYDMIDHLSGLYYQISVEDLQVIREVLKKY